MLNHESGSALQEKERALEDYEVQLGRPATSGRSPRTGRTPWRSGRRLEWCRCYRLPAFARIPLGSLIPPDRLGGVPLRLRWQASHLALTSGAAHFHRIV